MKTLNKIFNWINLCKKCQGELESVGTASNVTRCSKCFNETITIFIQ